MEFKITDLLDELQDASVELTPNTAASESRIKELTMKKVHNTQGKYASRRRGLGFVGKLLIAAAIITALAIPVMAASGLIFTDWQAGATGQEKPNYDANPDLGSESKKWDVSGWVVQISAENETDTGLTFVCQELGNPDKSGTLAAGDGWWLEKWDGAEYVPLDGKAADTNALPITSGSENRWEINWESIYGKVESGSYRIGKHFTYTNTAGVAEELTYYAKFRIFTQDMAPYLDQYRAAYDALHGEESYHLSHTQWPGRENDYEYYVTEVWRDGDDYLSRTTYYLADGSIYRSGGLLLRDGKGYSLKWDEFDVLSAITEWSAVDWVAPDNFDLWYSSMEVSESRLGEICVDGNILRFYSYYDWKDETLFSDAEIAELEKDYPTWNHDYTEMAYTFGEDGALVKIERTKMLTLDPETADPVTDAILQVYDTPADEIARIIASQDVTNPPAFSWAGEQAAYAETGKTEGLRNTSERPITTADQAIARARNEAVPGENPDYREGYDYNVVKAYFDPEAKMWKVAFTHSQDYDFVLIVYLNSDGVTQMTVFP